MIKIHKLDALRSSDRSHDCLAIVTGVEGSQCVSSPAEEHGGVASQAAEPSYPPLASIQVQGSMEY